MQLEGREYPLGFIFIWFAMKVAGGHSYSSQGACPRP